MDNLLNYQPSSYQSVLPNLRTTNGAIGVLPTSHYDRFLKRVVLNSLNLSATDLVTPATWTGAQSQTIVVQLRVGIVQNISSLLDATTLGDLNVAEYAVPLLIPRETELIVFWQDLLSTSTSKVSATLGLTS